MSGVSELVVSGCLPFGCVSEQIGGHRTRSRGGRRSARTPDILERFLRRVRRTMRSDRDHRGFTNRSDSASRRLDRGSLAPARGH
jgi:hypothetical protein